MDFRETVEKIRDNFEEMSNESCKLYKLWEINLCKLAMEWGRIESAGKHREVYETVSSPVSGEAGSGEPQEVKTEL